MSEDPGAGWHPDPTGGFQVRYHDGTRWTEHVSTDGKQATSPMSGGPPPPPPGAPGGRSTPPPQTGIPARSTPPSPTPTPTPKKRNTWKWVAGAIVVLVIIGAATSGSEDSSTSTNSASSSASAPRAASADVGSGNKKAADASGGCGTKASSDCTPHLPPDGMVRVDALLWSVRSATVKSAIGDQTYGLGAKANGKFLVVKIAVHSDKNESVTLTDDSIKLEVDGNTYDSDLDGTVAAAGTKDDPFFVKSIGPDSDNKGTVVFDVPESVLSKKIEVRFNELGFGDGHGYIRLPDVSE